MINLELRRPKALSTVQRLSNLLDKYDREDRLAANGLAGHAVGQFLVERYFAANEHEAQDIGRQVLAIWEGAAAYCRTRSDFLGATGRGFLKYTDGEFVSDDYVFSMPGVRSFSFGNSNFTLLFSKHAVAVCDAEGDKVLYGPANNDDIFDGLLYLAEHSAPEGQN